MYFWVFLSFNCSDATELIVNLSPQNKYFVGRREALNTLKSIIDNQKYLLLLGVGGIGKSQIAKEYAWANSEKYDFIWWVDASQAIKSQAPYFSKQWNLVQDYQKIKLSDNTLVVWENLVQTLSSSNKKGLIVFDDLKTGNDNIAAIDQIKKGSTKHDVVATTRNIHCNQLFNQSEKIKNFTREDSIDFLSRLHAKKYNSKEQLNSLGALLKDYPLSIAQAFAFIKNIDINVDQYMDLYVKKRDELSQASYQVTQVAGQEITDGYLLTTEITTTMTLDKIKQESLDSYDLLERLAFLNATDIPETLMLKIFNGDVLRTSNAIYKLMQYSFLDKKGLGKTNLYAMHEMISEIVRSKLTSNQRNIILSDLAKSLRASVPSSLQLSLMLFTEEPYFFNHLRQLLGYTSADQLVNDAVLFLKIKYLEYVLIEKRDGKEALKLITDIASVIDNKSITNHNKAKFELIKSLFSAWITDDLDQAIAEANRAETYLKKCKHVEEDYAIVYCRLCQAHAFQGSIEGVFKYADLFNKVVNKNIQIPTIYTIIVLQAEAIALCDRGKCTRAIEKINNALEENEKSMDGNMSPNVLAFLINKAKFMTISGQYKEALLIADEIDKLLEKTFKDMEYFYYAPHMIRADVLWRTNQSKDANVAIDKSMDILKIRYAQHNTKNNRIIAYVYTIAGDIQYTQGNYEKAIEYYQKAENAYNESLKYLKIKEVSELYVKLAKAYFDMRDYMLATKYRDKHEDLFTIADDNSLEINLYLNQLG